MVVDALGPKQSSEISQVINAIAELSKQIIELRQEVHERFDALEGHLTALETRVMEKFEEVLSGQRNILLKQNLIWKDVYKTYSSIRDNRAQDKLQEMETFLREISYHDDDCQTNDSLWWWSRSDCIEHYSKLIKDFYTFKNKLFIGESNSMLVNENNYADQIYSISQAYYSIFNSDIGPLYHFRLAKELQNRIEYFLHKNPKAKSHSGFDKLNSFLSHSYTGKSKFLSKLLAPSSAEKYENIYIDSISEIIKHLENKLENLELNNRSTSQSEIAYSYFDGGHERYGLQLDNVNSHFKNPILRYFPLSSVYLVSDIDGPIKYIEELDSIRHNAKTSVGQMRFQASKPKIFDMINYETGNKLYNTLENNRKVAALRGSIKNLITPNSKHGYFWVHPCKSLDGKGMGYPSFPVTKKFLDKSLPNNLFRLTNIDDTSFSICYEVNTVPGRNVGGLSHKNGSSYGSLTSKID